MSEFLLEQYSWLKALHVIAVMSWMAGMLYLPRLFVYHADAAPGSDKSETFKIMERRLLKFIINPAMIASFALGGLMLWLNPGLFSEGWMHVKLACLVLLTGVHGFCAKSVKLFARDANVRPAKFYRWLNEAPTVLIIIIVIMVVVRPF